MNEPVFYPHVSSLAELCFALGMERVVLSPGSRCAPLVFAFARHPHIAEITISDERSAAFIALGMAQATEKPVGLICTSGTALLNYGPAIAEAFYQEVPLVVLSADRPPAWIDQQDGQTIRQVGALNNHVKASYQLPLGTNHPEDTWFFLRQANEALLSCQQGPKGPVHLNIPFREPLYPAGNQVFDYKTPKHFTALKGQMQLDSEQWETLGKSLKKFRRILVAGGQQLPTPALETALQQLSCPVLGDNISNLPAAKNAISHQDAFLGTKHESLAQLAPELLITFGKSFISKNLKLFLRAHPLQEHWHVQESGHVADTFGQLTKIIGLTPEAFFKQIVTLPLVSQADFLAKWIDFEQKTADCFPAFFKSQYFSEFEAVWRLHSSIPPESCLHLANSMAVRYGNFLGKASGQKVFSNRGTSGIDGCTSTAVGHALANRQLQFLVTGDVAFFYDRNALWNNYLGNNLKILLLNNHGGVIFRNIQGPATQPELLPYFQTQQRLSAENTARDFGLNFFHASSREEFEEALPKFLAADTHSAIFEVEIPAETNAQVFTDFKQYLKKLFL